MCKKSLLTMCVGLLAFTAIAGATVTTFDGTTGLAGWTQVSSGDALFSPYGVPDVAPFSNLVQLTTPAATNVFGSGWILTAGQLLVTGAPVGTFICPAPGAYVGIHYQAPVGQVITGITLPQTYLSADTDMKLQITDAAGVVKATSVRVSPGELLLNLSAAGLNTSAVDIRFVNGTAGTGWWDAPLWNTNGVFFNTIQVTTIPEPATMGLLGLGVLGLLRRKHA